MECIESIKAMLIAHTEGDLASRKTLHELEASDASAKTKRDARRMRIKQIRENTNVMRTALINDRISEFKHSLRGALLIRKFQTFNSVLRAWNDRIFSELSRQGRWILEDANLDDIQALLETPTNDPLFQCVSNALGRLSAEEYSAANGVLPILSQAKKACVRSGWNIAVHTPPTIDEGIVEIEQSSLEDNHKATFIAAVRTNPKLSSGYQLFLPMNGESKVEKLEKDIQHLKGRLATWNG